MPDVTKELEKSILAKHDICWPCVIIATAVIIYGAGMLWLNLTGKAE